MTVDKVEIAGVKYKPVTLSELAELLQTENDDKIRVLVTHMDEDDKPLAEGEPSDNDIENANRGQLIEYATKTYDMDPARVHTFSNQGLRDWMYGGIETGDLIAKDNPCLYDGEKHGLVVGLKPGEESVVKIKTEANRTIERPVSDVEFLPF